MARPFAGNLYRLGAALDAWVAQVDPAPLDPWRRIVDPHQHLWQGPLGDFGIDAWQRHVAGNNVVATVNVECHQFHLTDGPQDLRPVGETRNAVAAARQAGGGATAFCAGIVGQVPLVRGDAVAAIIDAHVEAGEGRFRGLRQSAANDPAIAPSAFTAPPGLLGTDAFRAGMRHLAPRGLSLDLWLYFHQLSEAAELADGFPDTVLVVNHCGGLLAIGDWEDRPDEVERIWRDGLRRLAERPNVFLKIGGLGMPSAGSQRHLQPVPPTDAEIAEDWRARVETCVDRFGPDRCLFEANYPVDRQIGSYTAIWNAFKRIARQYSEPEQEALFAGTASRVYRLAL